MQQTPRKYNYVKAVSYRCGQMTTKFGWLVLCLLACFARVEAQQADLVLSQYDRLQAYYNPAYAGARGEIYISAVHNRQWEGMPGASKSFVILADAPIKFFGREHGVGLLITNDAIGLFSNTELALQYAFRQKLLGGVLSVAIEGAFYNSSFDGTKVELVDGVEDPAIPTTTVGGKSFDARAGIYYTHRNWYVGFSVRHLLNPQVKLTERYLLTLPRSYNLTAGYNIRPRASLFQWCPSIFVSTNGHESYRADITAAMSYNDKFFASLMYRVNAAAGLSFGMKFGSFYAGYAFEMPTSSLVNRNWGSHELVVSYNFPLYPEKKADVRYKSVRLL